MAKSRTSFKPGQSGNPHGRSAGQTERGKFRKAVEDVVPQVIEQLRTMALAGDIQAMKLILDRCIPPLRPADESVSFPLPEDASLSDQGQAILSAVSAGRLTTSQGKNLLDSLASHAKLVEQDELIQRLEALEQWLQSNNTKS